MSEHLTAVDVAYGDAELCAWPAKLGWNTPGADGTLRLYALDQGPAPRWHTPPRTIERAIDDQTFAREGARVVVVLVGDARVPDELLERCRAAAAAAVLGVLREHAQRTRG